MAKVTCYDELLTAMKDVVLEHMEENVNDWLTEDEESFVREYSKLADVTNEHSVSVSVLRRQLHKTILNRFFFDEGLV